MTLEEVWELDAIAQASGYTITDYRSYTYLDEPETIRYMLILEDEPGHEVSCMSRANFEIRRFDGIFD